MRIFVRRKLLLTLTRQTLKANTLSTMMRGDNGRVTVNKGVDGVAKPPDCGIKSFVAQPNPVTGQTEWVMQAEDYDYHQEIARAAYADMLHDVERNQKYCLAIQKGVELLRQRGCKVRALDIGAGTGLLSMMCARAGADDVTACEAFEPMADCASQVLKDNGLEDRINLVHARSTEMSVGSDGDMPERANLLVTEVFDTELIGEGAIGTFSHAHQRLLQKDSVVIPRAANVYMQPVCSEYIRRWNEPQPVSVCEGEEVRFPVRFSECGGTPSLHDLQLSQLSQDLFTPVCSPVKVFRFDFTQDVSVQRDERNEVQVVAEVAGNVDAIFMWWDLEMDPQGEIILSCAPHWAHPDGTNQPWRDHWMQAIYYPSQRLPVAKGETFRIIAQHDEYSLWFETASLNQTDVADTIPMCECGLHVTHSRQRLAMLSDSVRNQVYLSVLRKHINESSVCLCISDGGLLPVMAAKLGAKKVIAVEGNKMCADIVRSLVEHNKVQDTVVVVDKPSHMLTADDLHGLKVDVVLGEPTFQCHVLPWDNMHFWYAVNHVRPLLPPGAAILPGRMTVRAVAVLFKDLCKIRAPVGVCEGFDLSHFDKTIQLSADVVDEDVEPQPLWEYPSLAMSQPVDVLSLDFTQPLSTQDAPALHKTLHLHSGMQGTVNGVALWCDFDFGDGQIISTGPRAALSVGQQISWDPYSRQAVRLCRAPRPVEQNDQLTFDLTFSASSGHLKFVWHF